MPRRWLALGDSYTVGEGLPPDQRWPMQLAMRLREGGIDIADPRIIATTGWTTDELAAGIEAARPPGSWDFVTLGIGVNDQYRGRSLASYREGLSGLVDTALALADGEPSRILMLSIPDWGVTPFARHEGRDETTVARGIDAFNDLARATCEARGIAFVDITPASRDGGSTAAMLAGDGLHPSGAMYARWVDVALPVARGLLAA